MSTEQKTTLIVGGTGKSGARVARRLAARGLPTRIASRSGETTFDWNAPDTWAPALRGVESVYLSYFPDVAAPGSAEHIGPFAELAVASGVRRIVLLSGRNEPQTRPSERAVEESGAEYTILQVSWFAQNFSEGFFRDGVVSGELAFPGGDTAEPFIDLEDVADVAVAALTDGAHAGKIYELSGSRLVGFAGAAEEISRAIGRPVAYVPVSKEEYAATIAQFMPAEYVSFLSDLFEFLMDGHNAYISDGVERVLGRKARDFGDYVRDAARAGAWNP